MVEPFRKRCLLRERERDKVTKFAGACRLDWPEGAFPFLTLTGCSVLNALEDKNTSSDILPAFSMSLEVIFPSSDIFSFQRFSQCTYESSIILGPGAAW